MLKKVQYKNVDLLFQNERPINKVNKLNCSYWFNATLQNPYRMTVTVARRQT